MLIMVMQIKQNMRIAYKSIGAVISLVFTMTFIPVQKQQQQQPNSAARKKIYMTKNRLLLFSVNALQN